MGELLKTYPYLFSNFIILFFICIAARKLLSSYYIRMVLFSGIICTPCFIFIGYFENEYWNPVRLLEFTPGLEDVLISFNVGALVWLANLLFIKRHILYKDIEAFPHKRLGRIALYSTSSFLIGYYTGLSAMSSLILSNIVISILICIKKKQFLPLLFRLFWRFPLLYYMLIRGIYLIWPNAILQWNLNCFWGKPLLGVPAGEIVWSVVFGIYWTLFTGYSFNIEMKKMAGRGTPISPPSDKPS